MKKLILSLVLILCIFISKAQSGYFFAYAPNTQQKSVYFSYAVSVSNYSNCSSSNPKNCFLDDFINSLKIEVGEKYRQYDATVITKRNSMGYGKGEYFANQEDADRKRKELMADYAERGYTIYKLNL